MTSRPDGPNCYPLLESLLSPKGFPLKGIYTIRDAAQIFGVSPRTLQAWVRDGKLIGRELPGRGRFLSEDLETFLQRSLRRREALHADSVPSDIDARDRDCTVSKPGGRRQYAK